MQFRSEKAANYPHQSAPQERKAPHTSLAPAGRAQSNTSHPLPQRRSAAQERAALPARQRKNAEQHPSLAPAAERRVRTRRHAASNPLAERRRYKGVRRESKEGVGGTRNPPIPPWPPEAATRLLPQPTAAQERAAKPAKQHKNAEQHPSLATAAERRVRTRRSAALHLFIRIAPNPNLWYNKTNHARASALCANGPRRA